MKKNRIFQIVCAAALVTLAGACGEDHQTPPPLTKPDTPVVDPSDPTPSNGEKEKEIWLDFEANVIQSQNLATQANIKHYLDLCKDTGFNKIVVDVKPVEGYVAYKKATVLPLHPSIAKNDWDYLQFFLDEAKARGFKVTVSTTMFPMGSPGRKAGPVYSEPNKWKGRTSVEYTPTGMKDIKDDGSKVSAFLTPHIKENQELLLNMVKEIVTNYDFDGYALDYCRYCDVQCDFSDYARNDFEDYIKAKVESWPSDIFTYNTDGSRVQGKYYKQWFAFRAKTISDFVGKVRETIKAIKPSVKVEYWAASWWGALHQTGQNWASPSFDPLSDPSASISWYSSWCTADYARAGFANKLDIFLLGAYLNRVRGASDPESVEYAINLGKRFLQNNCQMYGTIQCADRNFDIEDACYYCLKNTDGLMVFDIVHVINNNKWEPIKRGIAKAEAEMAAAQN